MAEYAKCSRLIEPRASALKPKLQVMFFMLKAFSLYQMIGQLGLAYKLKKTRLESLVYVGKEVNCK